MAMEYTAKISFLRMAPRKVRSVGDLIKGLPVNEAEAQLIVQTRRPSKPLLKLLRSAVANAKNSKSVDPQHLFVSSVRVDGGPMLKRMLPRARGSASPIQKKMSHVTMVLGVNENLKSRFTIVPPKKTKLPPGQDKRTKAKKPQTEAQQEKLDSKSNPGFWRRNFGRKSGDK
jgi:large subunit ribosomal protein L22